MGEQASIRFKRPSLNGSAAPRPVEVSVRNATFGYRTGASSAIIRDLTVSFLKGQVTVIVGASGCGKTTLLKLIGGLLKPSAGELSVGDEDPSLQHARMGYMPARDGLLPWRTALENVALPLESGRTALGSAARLEKASELLRRVGLGRNERYYPEQLSHGMRQRVSLARALVADPEILLMDEPFGALDAQTRLRVQSDFLRTTEGSQRSVIMITHDLQEAILLADRVLVMAAPGGRIVADREVNIQRPRSDRLHALVLTDEFRSLYQDLVDIVMSEADSSQALEDRP